MLIRETRACSKPACAESGRQGGERVERPAVVEDTGDASLAARSMRRQAVTDFLTSALLSRTLIGGVFPGGLCGAFMRPGGPCLLEREGQTLYTLSWFRANRPPTRELYIRVCGWAWRIASRDRGQWSGQGAA